MGNNIHHDWHESYKVYQDDVLTKIVELCVDCNIFRHRADEDAPWLADSGGAPIFAVAHDE